MKIEAWKYYRTRGGHKVGPMRWQGGEHWNGYCVAADCEWGFHESGRFGMITGKTDGPHRTSYERHRDLIAEWSEPTREALTAELAALDARKAEVQAQIDKMPDVYRGYWGAASNCITMQKFVADTHYIEWTVENNVPRVIGDFKRIE